MGKKKRSTGPPCLVPHWHDKLHKAVQAKVVRYFFFVLLDSAAFHSSVLGKASLFTVHNIDAVQQCVLIEIPICPKDLSAEELLQNDKLITLSLNVDQSIRYSPAMSAMTLLNKKGLKESIDLKKKPIDIKSILLTSLQKQQLGFPTTGVKLDTHLGSNKVFAIDCEMCKSGNESVLTRMAVLDFETGLVLYNKLVKPETPITDYVTPYSGITEEMLKDVKFSLKDAQQLLKKTIGSSDIILGHSLENDFKVLEIIHENIIDTATLFPHIRGLPFRNSLRYISKKYLNKDIQAGQHDPEIDARTCIDLTKLILENGLAFGDILAESVPLSTFLKKHNLSTSYIGPQNPGWDMYGTGNHVIKSTPKEVLNAAKSCQSNFIGLTLIGNGIETILTEYLEHIPDGTAICVCVGPHQTEYDEFMKLNDQRRNFKREYTTKKWDEIEAWTQQKEDLYLKARDKLTQFKVSLDIKVNKDEIENLPKKVRSNFT